MSISSHFLDRAIEGLERGNVWIAFNRTFTDVEIVRKDCSVLRALKSSFLCGGSNKYSRIDAKEILAHLKERDWSQIEPTKINRFYSLFKQSIQNKYSLEHFKPQMNKEESIPLYENIIFERSFSSFSPEKFPSIKLRDEQGNTELHQAILFREKDSVRPKTVLENTAKEIIRLIKEGVDPTIQNNAGDTVLHLIADLPYWDETHDELVELLLSYNVQVNVPNKQGITAFSRIISAYCSASIIHTLVKKGSADVNARDCYGNTALHLIADSDGAYSLFEAEPAKVLLEYGADINMCNFSGNTPLHMAIANRKDIKEAIQFFICEGKANINAQNKHGNTPLHLLASNNHLDKWNHVEMVEFLLKHGADKTIKNKEGELPIHLAYERQGSKVIDLLEVDLDFEITNSSQQTFLHLAARDSSKDMEIFIRQLQKTKNIMAVDKFGNTALHYASRDGFHEAVEFLIENKARVNIGNKEGNTPLHLAVSSLLGEFKDVSSDTTMEEVKRIIAVLDSNKKNSKKKLRFNYDSPFLKLNGAVLINIVNQLLVNGADPYKKNKKGESAIDQCFMWAKMFFIFK